MRTKLSLLLAAAPLIVASLSLNAKADTSFTISGISSGAFLAQQMGVIYSDKVTGVGSVAGGFYFCAENYLQDKEDEAKELSLGSLSLYSTTWNMGGLMSGDLTKAVKVSRANPIYQAVGVCMQNPNVANVDVRVVSDNRQQSLIADPVNLKNQKIYLYQGQADTVVNFSMLDKVKTFYASLGVPAANIKVTPGVGGHNFPTDRMDQSDCKAQSVPYVSSCGLNVAGEILTQVLGNSQLVRSQDHDANLQNLYRVSQSSGNLPHPSSVADYGYLAASPECLKNPQDCSLHVALHGCEMSDSFDSDFDQKYNKALAMGYPQMRSKAELQLSSFLPVEDTSALPYIEQRQDKFGLLRFAMDSGYLDYVAKNKLMVLFPQTWITEDNYPLNPKGCWDWFGWTGRNYATNQGSEASWLYHWIQAIQQNPQSFIQPGALNFTAAKALGAPTSWTNVSGIQP